MGSDRTRGLYSKYRVERVDGKYPDSTYFVLRDGDPFARVAALAYADACESKYPALAADLRRWAEKGGGGE